MFSVELPVAETVVFWPAIVLIGLCIGFLTGLFGVGGSFLLMPSLRYIAGVPYHIAVGSGLVQIFITAVFSTHKHRKRQNVDIKLGTLTALGAVLGVNLGAYILEALKQSSMTVRFAGGSVVLVDLVLSLLFALLMVMVAFIVRRDTKRSAEAGSEEADTALARYLHSLNWRPTARFQRSGIESMSIWIPLVISFVVGALTGLMGVGGGFVMFPLLVYVLGVPTSVAVGTSAYQIVFAAGYGAVSHYFKNNVDLLLIVFMLPASLLGAQLGVLVSERIGGRRIRRYFGLVLLLGILVVVIGLAGDIWGGK